MDDGSYDSLTSWDESPDFTKKEAKEAHKKIKEAKEAHQKNKKNEKAKRKKRKAPKKVYIKNKKGNATISSTLVLQSSTLFFM